MKNRGGQFEPELGGHFQPKSGGHFKSELGGQFDRNLHIEYFTTSKVQNTHTQTKFFTNFITYIQRVYSVYIASLWRTYSVYTP